MSKEEKKVHWGGGLRARMADGALLICASGHPPCSAALARKSDWLATRVRGAVTCSRCLVLMARPHVPGPDESPPPVATACAGPESIVLPPSEPEETTGEVIPFPRPDMTVAALRRKIAAFADEMPVRLVVFGPELTNGIDLGPPTVVALAASPTRGEFVVVGVRGKATGA